MEESREACAADRAALEKEKAKVVKQLQRVAHRERTVEVKEQLTDVRAKLEEAGTTLLDACDTVEQELVGEMITAALDMLEGVKCDKEALQTSSRAKKKKKK